MARSEYNFLFDIILPENNLLRKFSTLAEGLPHIIQMPIRITFNKLATILRYVQHNIEYALNNNKVKKVHCGSVRYDTHFRIQIY